MPKRNLSSGAEKKEQRELPHQKKRKRYKKKTGAITGRERKKRGVGKRKNE